MKYSILLLIIIACFSCSDSFINHKLSVEKLGACNAEQSPVNMSANIAGERYEFISCLDENFDGKNYSVERKGDSIVVTIPKTATAKAAFKLTLDIDAKPAYHHIILDGIDIPVTAQQ